MNRTLSTVTALLVLALGVWGVSWLTQEEQQGSSTSILTQATGGERVRFKTLTPHEARKKARLDAARRELERVKRTGEKVGNMYRVKDISGDDLYVYPELIEGHGRFGEPLYLMAQAKRLPSVPAKVPARSPKDKTAPKLAKKPGSHIKFAGKKKDDKDDG